MVELLVIAAVVAAIAYLVGLVWMCWGDWDDLKEYLGLTVVCFGTMALCLVALGLMFHAMGEL